MTIITKVSHPALFECLETISHDNGAGAGHSEYAIPDEWDRWCAAFLPAVELALAALSEDERQNLSIGELSDMSDIAYRSSDLWMAHSFFSAFFNDFDPSAVHVPSRLGLRHDVRHQKVGRLILEGLILEALLGRRH